MIAVVDKPAAGVTCPATISGERLGLLDVAAYRFAGPNEQVPLTAEDLRAAVGKISTWKTDRDWCLIGGTAIHAWLSYRHSRAADSRASLDIDVAGKSMPPQLYAGQRLVNRGRRVEIAIGEKSIPVKWLVYNHGDPLSRLWSHMIARSGVINGSWRVAQARHLLALKLVMPKRAIRPKDRNDVRLLIESNLTTSCEALDLIARYAKDRYPVAQIILEEAVSGTLHSTRSCMRSGR